MPGVESLSPLEPVIFPKRRLKTKSQLQGFCAGTDWVERLPTTPRPLQDLGGDRVGTASAPTQLYSFRGPGCPKVQRGVIPHFYCPPLSLAKPFKANVFPFVQERISRTSSLLPTRFQLASVGGVRFGRPPTLSPRPHPLLEEAPFCSFISSPPPAPLLQQSSSPGFSSLLRHQSLVRAGSNLHRILGAFLKLGVQNPVPPDPRGGGGQG